MHAINVDLAEKSAWVEADATFGELYYRVAKKSNAYGIVARLCTSLGLGRHITGGAYGFMMRKYRLGVDNALDAKIINSNREIFDRKSMGEDIFWARMFFGRLEAVVGAATETISTTYNALYLGPPDALLKPMKRDFPELSLKKSDCFAMSWLESIMFIAGFPKIVPTTFLLSGKSTFLNYFKAKSDFVKTVIPKKGLKGMWARMLKEEIPLMIWNPYGGMMERISELATPFPHRKASFTRFKNDLNLFTLKVNHGGVFTYVYGPKRTRAPRRVYKGRNADWFDDVDVDGFSVLEVSDNGLEPLSKDIDVLDMLSYVNKYKLMEVFIEHPIENSVMDTIDLEQEDASDGLGDENVGNVANDLGDEKVEEFDPLFSYPHMQTDNNEGSNHNEGSDNNKGSAHNNGSDNNEGSKHNEGSDNNEKSDHEGSDNNEGIDHNKGSDNNEGSDHNEGSDNNKGSDHNEVSDDNNESDDSDFECDIEDRIDDVHVDMQMFKDNIDPNIEWVSSTEPGPQAENNENLVYEEVDLEDFDSEIDSDDNEAERSKALRKLDTTVNIDVERDYEPGSMTRQFRRIYVCLGALKSGFKAGQRDLLGQDGCFMSGPFPMQILTAVDVDPNYGIYPLAYAIVESENKQAWLWFLDCLGDDLELFRNSNFTFVTDRKKGFVPALTETFPAAEHRYYLKHIYDNMKLQWRGQQFKDLLWKCATATTVFYFNKNMEELKAGRPSKKRKKSAAKLFDGLVKNGKLGRYGSGCYGSVVVRGRMHLWSVQGGSFTGSNIIGRKGMFYAVEKITALARATGTREGQTNPFYAVAQEARIHYYGVTKWVRQCS
nr:transposase, mutator type [Tanacetum cinerariifolium]